MDQVLSRESACRAVDRPWAAADMSANYTGPRNRIAFERGQRAREAIFQAWGELVLEFAYHWPAVSRPPTAKDVARRLPDRYRRLSERTIAWHMSRITLEAPLVEEEGCALGNSSAAEALAE